MSEIAEKSMGTKLVKVKSGSEAADLTIAHLTTIGEIGIESDEIETTTLDSEGGYREFIASLKDAGEMSLEGMIKNNDAMEAMLALADGQSVESWYIEFLSGDKWEFDGFLKAYKEGESTIDGVRTFSGAIRISGKPTYTPNEVSV